MTPQETAKLLTYVGELDNRQITKQTVQAWHDVLGRYSLKQCIEAVSKHFHDSTDWLMPAHVAGLIRRVRDERFMALPDASLSDADLRGNGDYREAMRELRAAVGDGVLTPEGYRAYQRSGLRLRDFLASGWDVNVPERHAMPPGAA